MYCSSLFYEFKSWTGRGVGGMRTLAYPILSQMQVRCPPAPFKKRRIGRAKASPRPRPAGARNSTISSFFCYVSVLSWVNLKVIARLVSLASGVPQTTFSSAGVGLGQGRETTVLGFEEATLELGPEDEFVK